MMKRILGMALAFTALACASTFDFHMAVMGVGEISGTYAPASGGSWRVEAPFEICWTLEFKQDAKVLRSVTGQGTMEGTIPPGVNNWDLTRRECDGGDAPPPNLVPLPLPAFDRPVGLFDITAGRGNFGLDADGRASFAFARGVGWTEWQARALAEDVLEAGPGVDVDDHAQVIAMIDVEVGPGGATIVSSLPSRFADFHVMVDDVVMADLAAHWNATATPAGEGWVTIESKIPASLLAAGSLIEVTQVGTDADESFEATMQL